MIRRARARLSILLIAALLFQQVAVAAYACEQVEGGPPAPSGLADCAQMDMAPVAEQASALCEKHCLPDLSVSPDMAAPSVPALLSPASFALVLNAPARQRIDSGEPPTGRADPPPRLRFCSLLI